MLKDEGLLGEIAALRDRAKDIKTAEAAISAIVKRITPALIGKRIKARHGNEPEAEFQITAVEYWCGPDVKVRGRKVLAGSGKLGSQEWDCGALYAGRFI